MSDPSITQQALCPSPNRFYVPTGTERISCRTQKGKPFLCWRYSLLLQLLLLELTVRCGVNDDPSRTSHDEREECHAQKKLGDKAPGRHMLGRLMVSEERQATGSRRYKDHSPRSRSFTGQESRMAKSVQILAISSR